MQRAVFPSFVLALPVLIASLLPGFASTAAACSIEPADQAGALVRHLIGECTLSEREAHAVTSASIMHALRQGHSVDLVGVIVRGDLSLDDLPVQTTRMPKGLSEEQQAALAQLNSGEVRLVHGALTIRDSVIDGSVRHRSPKGTLQFEGPLDLRGTTFKEGLDLSRSVFQGTVDLSGAKFERESYFVQGQFAGTLTCKETNFGPHTRFHRSVFRGAVDCTAALFDGMAEFLEVTFEQPVAMERTRFGSGTGFSGSRFMRHASFSEAVFSRDTFFGFTVFEGDVSFRDAQFLGSADFSDAEFKRPDDLMKARFDHKPLLTRTKRVTEPQERGLLQSPAGQYTVTLFFLLLAALLVAYAMKIK